MIPIVVMASGRGSNFDALHAAIQKKKLQARIVAVISDKPSDVGVLAKARDAGIPAVSVPFPTAASGSIEARRLEHEKVVLEELRKFQPKFLVLAGYMRVLTSNFIEAFRCEKGYVQIVNIHPSLLPSFPGVHSYAQAFRYGARVAGVTVHLVESEVDSGPICAQEAFSIEDCHSETDVEQRGLAVEHRLYPQTLEWVLAEKFSLERRAEGRFYVRQN